MVSFHKSLYTFFPLFFTLLCFSRAANFNVGGKDGWSLHPSENYSQWSGRLRFNVNDTLHFKYNSGSDSVLAVNKGDYDSCNTSNPITTLTGGDSVFSLNHPGPFYFISGNKSNCDQGQKIEVVVISPKKRATPVGAPAPASGSMVPMGSPVSSPPEGGSSISASPVGSPGGVVSGSPMGGPEDVNAPAPTPTSGGPGGPESAAARPAISATFTVSFAMIMIGFWWVC